MRFAARKALTNTGAATLGRGLHIECIREDTGGGEVEALREGAEP